MIIEFGTPRLRLRQWRDSDRAPFAALNSDPKVMEFFPAHLTPEESDASLNRARAHIAERGWGNWAAELIASGEFIGFIGLSVPKWTFPFSPCVEIGWRLARRFWGQGLASEAARATLQVGFERIGLEEIVSFTALPNQRSRAVMERIGMKNVNQDFEHPALPDDHWLRTHCLYRIRKEEWTATASAMA